VEVALTTLRARTTFFHALALVLGFAAVFTFLGASVGLLGSYLFYDVLPLIVRVGAVILFVFALCVTHLHLKVWQWALVALVAGALTYRLSLFEAGEAARIAGGVLVGLIVLAAADWDRAALAVLTLVIAGLSWLTSDLLTNPALRLGETLLVGLVVYGGYRTDVFERELRLGSVGESPKGASYVRSALVGVIFAAGWTPCVGPILAGILLLASQTQTVGQGALLLATYSLGLGIPFLLAGALFSQLLVYLPRFYRFLPAIEVISGIFLFFIGVLMFTDSLAQLAGLGSFLNIESGLAPAAATEITLVLAFVAGVISFLSPCVLPLVPAYLGYLSGAALSNRPETDRTASTPSVAVEQA
jgi:cytochrome c-type biogenesis protein